MDNKEDFDCVIELENLLGVNVSRFNYYLDGTTVQFTDDPVTHLYNLVKNLTKPQKEKAVKYLMLRKELHIKLINLGLYNEFKHVLELPSTYTGVVFSLGVLQYSLQAADRMIRELELTTNFKDFSIRSINK